MGTASPGLGLNLRGGFTAVRECQHDAYLLDYRLGAWTGSAPQEPELKSCNAPIIFLTGQGSGRSTSRRCAPCGGLPHQGRTHRRHARADAAALARAATATGPRLKHLNEVLETRYAERTRDLERANAALRLANQRKDEFLAILAHELRNR